jgi:hypothetical protein
VLYAEALRAGFVWDDLLTAVPPRPLRDALLEPTGSWYRPLVMASFALDRALWGPSPFGFHLTNVLLHVAVAGCLGTLARAAGLGAGASLAAALVFLAHPVQTEGVTYVSGRTDVLAALMALAGLLAWRRARSTCDRWALASAAALGGALLCKEAAVLLPLALLVPGAHPGPARPRPVLPAAVAALWALAFAGASGPAAALGALPARVPAIGVAALGYVRLLLWPSDLHLERFTPVPGWSPAAAAAAWAALAALGVGAVAAARRVHGGTFFLAVALLAYAPVSGVVPVYGAVADRVLFTPEHFLYLPLLGLAPLAVATAARLWPPRAARALPAALAVVLVAWGAVVADRNRDWRDEETLFRHTLRWNPPSARVWFNSGNVALAAGRLEEAERLYREALAREPGDGAAHLNLAITLERRGDARGAEDEYRRAIASDPRLEGAYRGLAARLAARGDVDAARRVLESAPRAGRRQRSGSRPAHGARDARDTR